MRSPRLAVEPVRKIMVAEDASRILTLIFVAPICSCAVSGGVEVMADIAVDAVEGCRPAKKTVESWAVRHCQVMIWRSEKPLALA